LNCNGSPGSIARFQQGKRIPRRLLKQFKASVLTALQETPAVFNAFVIALHVCKNHAGSENFFAS
jgi:hypothetical protein